MTIQNIPNGAIRRNFQTIENEITSEFTKYSW